MFFIAFIPLIYFAKLDLHQFDYLFPGLNWQGKYFDFFSYYKSLAIIGCGAAAVAAVAADRFFKPEQARAAQIRMIAAALAAFTVLILLSSIGAGDANLAWWGSPERFEGFWVWLSYILVAASAVFVVRDSAAVRKITTVLAVSAAVIGVIGILQWLGYNPFNYRVIQLMFMPKEYWDLVFPISNTSRQIYSTLYNPNNAGMYMAMLLPLLTVLFLAAERMPARMVLGLLGLLIWANLLGTQARAALLAVLVTIILAVMILVRQNALAPGFKSRAALALAAMLLVFAVMDYHDNGRFSNRFASMLNITGPAASNIAWQRDQNSAGALYSGLYCGIPIKLHENGVLLGEGEERLRLENHGGLINIFDSQDRKVDFDKSDDGRVFMLKDLSYSMVVLNNNQMTITYQKTSFHFDLSRGLLLWSDPVSPDLADVCVSGPRITLTDLSGSQVHIEREPGWSFTNRDGNPLASRSLAEGAAIILEPSGYEDYIFYVEGDTLRIVKGGRSFTLAWEDSRYKAVDGYGRRLAILDYSDGLFKGHESELSSRAYIWSRSLPMIRQSLLIGLGPDNYIMSFPQDDYLGKWLYMNNPDTVLDKPHNLYLQIMINSGGLSLLCFLLAMALLFKWSWSSLKNAPQWDYRHIYLLAGMAAAGGYLLSGMAYDSSVSISPVFWGIIGLCAALNNMIATGTGAAKPSSMPAETN